MSGTLYGIGVGPGDPELITLKALNCLRQSDVVILPAEPKEECYAYKIVKEVYPEVKDKEIICMSFPMMKRKEELRALHNKIYEDIAGLLEQEKTVSFLTIGDPSIYSTYSYIHTRVKKDQGNAVMVSGVPSFCAAAAAVGISLGDNKDEIHIIPGCYEIEETLKLSGTKIYMKSGKKLAELKKKLQQSDRDQAFKVYAVSNCGMEHEKRMVGLEHLEENSEYLTIVIVRQERA